AFSIKHHAFLFQQQALQQRTFRRGTEADVAAVIDDAVPGHVRACRQKAQGIAYRPGGPRLPQQGCHLAISHHFPRRDLAYQSVDILIEMHRRRIHRRFLFSEAILLLYTMSDEVMYLPRGQGMEIHELQDSVELALDMVHATS